MSDLHNWFIDTDKVISESKYISRGLFWQTSTKVFSGEITPDEGAKIIDVDIMKKLETDIANEIISRIEKGEI